MRLMLAGLALVIGFVLATVANAQMLRFQADDWVAECGSSQGADAECSIIGVFSSTNAAGPKGSFSLLVDLRNRMVAVVGKPFPSRASIRVDRRWSAAANVIVSSLTLMPSTSFVSLKVARSFLRTCSRAKRCFGPA